MSLNRLLRTISVASALSFTSFVSAYQVQPMVAELHTAGNRSSITYRVINPDDVPVPIEVEVMKRSFDENQQEILTEAEDDFIILPPQVDVPANGYQIFRAQYIGETDFTKTQSYRIVFKQLPIEDGSEESQVNMIFNFATLVFVSPPKAEGQLKQTLNCETAETCQLTVINEGDAVMPLLQSKVNINGEMQGDWQWLQTKIPVTYLMPEHKIEIKLTDLVTETTLPKSAEMVTADNAN